jgi:hypothetical protein
MDDRALYNTFLDLHNKLGKKGLNIILGGGYGLFLKQLALMSEPSAHTLIAGTILAEAKKYLRFGSVLST